MSKPAKKASVRNSGWFITANTQQRFASGEAARPLLLSLQTALRSVLGHPEQYVQFLNEGDSWRPGIIAKVSTRQGVEWSPEHGMAHAHALIQVKHSSRIRLDYAKVKQTISSYLLEKHPALMRDKSGKAKRIYVYIKVFRPTDNFEDYIAKDAAVRDELGLASDVEPSADAISP